MTGRSAETELSSRGIKIPERGERAATLEILTRPGSSGFVVERSLLVGRGDETDDFNLLGSFSEQTGGNFGD